MCVLLISLTFLHSTKISVESLKKLVWNNLMVCDVDVAIAGLRCSNLFLL